MLEQPPVIELTLSAAEAIVALLAEEGATGHGLRLQLVGGGCAGLCYEIELVAGPAPGDKVGASLGVPIFIDRRALPLVAGTRVDYQGGFRFENPNARQTCRCGASFR